MGIRDQAIYDLPAYGSSEAARYLGLSPHTLSQWISVNGLIQPPIANALSFNNLAEAHVLKAMRRGHGLSMQAIRKALKELGRIRKTAHPLLDESFETDGVNLCIREDDRVINLSRKQQQEFRDLVAIYLHRVHRRDGVATLLHPFITPDSLDQPEHISISPTISFGKPVLAGTGISTSVIVGRFKARDSVASLAEEYQIDATILEDAIRWEMSQSKAA